ncbi:MAG TPA: hypothetical protein VMT54_11250 [Candidatus Cybelea sp.]|nr:hypothetical protein [Candidatus Cybelea sp.]
MRGFAKGLAGFGIAAWVMASIVVAIAYGLCIGTAEAITPHDHKTMQRG